LSELEHNLTFGFFFQWMQRMIRQNETSGDRFDEHNVTLVVDPAQAQASWGLQGCAMSRRNCLIYQQPYSSIFFVLKKLKWQFMALLLKFI
jgi:hypothetical protein